MHQQFLQQVVDLACDNVANGGGPFAAMIVKNRQIIAIAGNRVTASLDPTAHAEMLAIREACAKLGDYQLTDCVLYCSCEPCPMCLGAIYWSRLAAVYYACNRFDAADAGFDDNFIYSEITKAGEKRQIAMLQLALPQANKPFLVWREAADKVLY